MDFYGLDAMAHGATAALLVLLPAVFGFWRLTRGMAGGHARHAALRDRLRELRRHAGGRRRLVHPARTAGLWG